MMNYHQHYQTELTNVMLIENIIVCLDSLLRSQDTSTDTLAKRYVKAKISIKLLHSQCSENCIQILAENQLNYLNTSIEI